MSKIILYAKEPIPLSPEQEIYTYGTNIKNHFCSCS